MIEVVDATGPAAIDAAAAARAQAILQTRPQPTRGYLVAPEMLAGLLHSAAVGVTIPTADQRWWQCPCKRDGGVCPYRVLYGPLHGWPRIGFVPAVCFEEAAPIEAAGTDTGILAIHVGSIADIDSIPARVEAAGRPGFATMMMVWFELGLRDTLIAALGRVEST